MKRKKSGAVRFDPQKLQLTGSPVLLMEGVLGGLGSAEYAANAQTFAYIPGPVRNVEPRQLLWRDRAGNETPITDRRLPYFVPRLSPDGKKLAVTVYGDGRFGIAILDLDRGSFTSLQTSGSSAYPMWNRDGSKIAYTSNSAGPNDLYQQPADGSGRPALFASSGNPAFRKGNRYIGKVCRSTWIHQSKEDARK